MTYRNLKERINLTMPGQTAPSNELDTNQAWKVAAAQMSMVGKQKYSHHSRKCHHVMMVTLAM
jgi:hypothetical protein